MVPEDGIRPHLIADSLRRRWWMVAATTLVMLVLAGVFLATQQSTYTATTSVFLRPSNGNALDSQAVSNGQQTTIAMETEAGLISSPGVTKLVRQRLAAPVEAGAPYVNAIVANNTQILEVSYTAQTPSEAQQGAQAYADAFLSFRKSRSEGVQRARLQSLKGQVDEASDQLKNATALAAKRNATSDAQAQVEVYTSRLAALRESMGKAEMSGSSPGFIVRPATKPASPDGLPMAVMIVGAGLLGVGLGAALAIWSERRDGRVRGEVDPEVGGVPVLALVPKLSPPGLAASDCHTVKDLYRRVSVGVLARARRGSVLVVGGWTAEEPTAEVTANLAVALAEAGYATALVDATEDGSGSAYFGVEHEPGLQGALSGQDSAAPVVVSHKVSVLPAGGVKAVTPERLAGPKMRSLLEELSQRQDYVLVVSKPVASAELEAVALASDGVLLVVGDRGATREDITAAHERLDSLGATLMGVVCTQGRAASGRAAKHAAQVTSAEPVEEGRSNAASQGVSSLMSSGAAHGQR